MTAQQAVQQATAYFDSGEFQRILARRVAQQTESQRQDRDSELQRYLQDEIGPQLIALGFTLHFIDNPEAVHRPFLVAVRIEDPSLPTLLSYGHGDVVFGDDENWREGLSPWHLVEEGDRWYARGSADNKGQHCVNLAALEQVYKARGGKLGFNCKMLFEMGEEISSPGLAQLCQQHGELLQADLFIASDGPRLNAIRPTLFLGSRGAVNFRLTINARDNAYHSGNWGGLLTNPGTQLANAIAALVNAQGVLQVDALKPNSLTAQVRAILADIEVGGMPGDPAIDVNWGEPGLTPTERVYGWNTLEVLSFLTGNPARPMNAIPGSATAVCQLRFVVGTEPEDIVPALRRHLDAHGFERVEIRATDGEAFRATRVSPDHPWVKLVTASLERTEGKPPHILPNLAGSLPNDAFSEILGLPTVWVPHSYGGCCQHAPNEHVLGSLSKSALRNMAGIFADIAESGGPSD